MKFSWKGWKIWKNGGIVDLEGTASDIVNCALSIHRAVGPGMLESAYEAMLDY